MADGRDLEVFVSRSRPDYFVDASLTPSTLAATASCGDGQSEVQLKARYTQPAMLPLVKPSIATTQGRHAAPTVAAHTTAHVAPISATSQAETPALLRQFFSFDMLNPTDSTLAFPVVSSDGSWTCTSFTIAPFCHTGSSRLVVKRVRCLV
jgi:hypothetical protein